MTCEVNDVSDAFCGQELCVLRADGKLSELVADHSKLPDKVLSLSHSLSRSLSDLLWCSAASIARP